VATFRRIAGCSIEGLEMDLSIVATARHAGHLLSQLDPKSLLALQASGLDQINVAHRPRLLSDNGPSYVSTELAEWLDEQDMRHIRGAP
jgi:putative transposase